MHEQAPLDVQSLVPRIRLHDRNNALEAAHWKMPQPEHALPLEIEEQMTSCCVSFYAAIALLQVSAIELRTALLQHSTNSSRAQAVRITNHWYLARNLSPKYAISMCLAYLLLQFSPVFKLASPRLNIHVRCEFKSEGYDLPCHLPTPWLLM